MSGADPAGGPELEALRRRLYLPGATQQDIDAFHAAEQRLQVRAAEPAAHEQAARRLPRRTVLLAGGAAVVVAAAGTAAAVVLGRPRTPAAPAPRALGLNAVDRAELLANLGRNREAGIAAYLVTHVSPPGLRSATLPITVEDGGTGSGAMTLSPPGVGGDAGRATVLAVVADSGPLSWTAYRLGTAGSPVVRRLPVASRAGRQTAGDLTIATFAYGAGRRPVRLEVQVPDGVRWGAAVVFTT